MHRCTFGEVLWWGWMKMKCFQNILPHLRTQKRLSSVKQPTRLCVHLILVEAEEATSGKWRGGISSLPDKKGKEGASWFGVCGYWPSFLAALTSPVGSFRPRRGRGATGDEQQWCHELQAAQSDKLLNIWCFILSSLFLRVSAPSTACLLPELGQVHCLRKVLDEIGLPCFLYE